MRESNRQGEFAVSRLKMREKSSQFTPFFFFFFFFLFFSKGGILAVLQTDVACHLLVVQGSSL